MITTNRGLVKYILLSLLTFGIYGLWFVHGVAKDANIICYGDGKKTAGLIKVILLSIITCGVYSYFWHYNIGNRLAENAIRYGLEFSENGTTILIWMIVGMITFGIGNFVVISILSKNMNLLAIEHNEKNNINI